MLQKLMQIFRCSSAQKACPGSLASSAADGGNTESLVNNNELQDPPVGNASGRGAAATTSEKVSNSHNGGEGVSPPPNELRSPGDVAVATELPSRGESSPDIMRRAHTLLHQHFNSLTANEQSGFLAEFSSLQDPSAPYEAARNRANASKNRYSNVLPFDFNRVRMEDDEWYINASLVKSSKDEEPSWTYVAAQGSRWILLGLFPVVL
eukprot:gene12155-15268_t